MAAGLCRPDRAAWALLGAHCAVQPCFNTGKLASLSRKQPRAYHGHASAYYGGVRLEANRLSFHASREDVL